MKALSIGVFKRRFGLTQAEVNDLARSHKIQIQQNGYKGHVLEHHKIVAYPDDFDPTPRRSFFNPPVQEAIILQPPEVDHVNIRLRSTLIDEIELIAKFDHTTPAELIQTWIREGASRYRGRR